MSQLNVNLIKNHTGTGGPTLEALTVNNDSTLCGVRFIAGQLCESVNIVSSTLSASSDIDLSAGMIHYFTSQESAQAIPNLSVSGKSVNQIMAVGEAISVVLMLTASTAGYIKSMTIDGVSVTPMWGNGGVEPSDGGVSGIDIYTIQVIKTADSTYTVLANSSNFA